VVLLVHLCYKVKLYKEEGSVHTTRKRVFEVVCGHKNLRLIEVLLAAEEAIQFFPYNSLWACFRGGVQSRELVQ
jgi:hypothetical protein